MILTEEQRQGVFDLMTKLGRWLKDLFLCVAGAVLVTALLVGYAEYGPGGQYLVRAGRCIISGIPLGKEILFFNDLAAAGGKCEEAKK